ncbi:MAG: hypothetical protein WD016_07710 [Balneolaceae bacterium]
MLIGGDFNGRAKELLAALYKMCEGNTDYQVAVDDLVENLQLDRTEMKNLLEYLEAKELVLITTIGGPFLYGHIRITEKGILKVLST